MEKALEEYSTYKDEPFRRTHVLPAPVLQCEAFDAGLQRIQEAAKLPTPNASDFRYPGFVKNRQKSKRSRLACRPTWPANGDMRACEAQRPDSRLALLVASRRPQYAGPAATSSRPALPTSCRTSAAKARQRSTALPVWVVGSSSDATSARTAA